MNQLSVVVALLALALSSCSRVHRREEPKKSEATTKCEELCKADTGIDADSGDCLTECAVATDLETHHLDEGTDYFVEDEAHNEKGGEKMLEQYNEKATEEVPECVPQEGYEEGTTPTFDKLDTNKDGTIDEDEAISFGEKACIPDEMVMQLFSEADLNQDKVIGKDEFKAAGEDTKNEEAMDDALEEVSEGDDESNTVQNPPMTEFDENNDGSLDKEEATDMMEHEIERRTEHAPIPEETKKELEPKIDEAIDKVDTNDDGVISGDEYVAESEDGGSDLGKELEEATEADEDKPELDDLARADGKAAAEGLISRRTMLRRGHGAKARGQQHKMVSFGEAMLAKAKLQERLRNAMFLQHQQRLHRAMLLQKKARTFRQRK